MKEDFDQIFGNKYGRYFDPNTISRPELLNNALNGFNMHIDWLRRGNANLPPVKIGFIDNSYVGAVVTKNKDKYYIGIYIGTYFLLHDLFFRMLSNPNVLTEFGDTSKESETIKIYNPINYDLNKLFLATDPTDKNIPKNEQRHNLARWLTVNASMFLVCHEYAHIIFGHVDYLINQKNQAAWSEEPANVTSPSRIEPLLSQTLEFDADSYAIATGIRHIQAILKDLSIIKDELLPFFKDLKTAVRLWLFSIYSLFRIFGFKVPEVKELKTLSHPPSGLRQRIVFGTLFTFFEQSPEIMDDLRDLVLKTINEVEAAFQEISETPLNKNAFKLAMQQESHGHITFLMNNWSNVRPLLEPYSYGNLAPLPQ